MTILYYDPISLEHDTGAHPENTSRMVAIQRQLNASGLNAKCKQHAWEPISVERLCYVHTAEYVASVAAYAANGGGRIETDTVVSNRSYEVARVAAGAVADAVGRVIGGEDKTAFCIVRPPGHHAMPEHAMGFCLFNNVAVGARLAMREFALDRVLVVDFDVHHGNGTQAMFWKDSQVGFLSIHRSPFYPGTGAADETGEHRGLGTTMNLPLHFGTTRKQYLTKFRTKLQSFADQIQPQLVLLSAGFDSHTADPVGSLGLESEDFTALTRAVLEVAKVHADGRLVSVLEGGYNPVALGESVGYHVDALLNDAR